MLDTGVLAELKERISPAFDEALLSEILKYRAHGRDAKLEQIVLKGERGKGDSYLSVVVQFKLVGKTVQTNEPIEEDVIVKCLPKSVSRRKSFRSTDFFDNEATFYTQVWPQMQEFIGSNTDSTALFDIIPKCYRAFSDGESDFVAMEDLSGQGYVSFPRQKEMSLEQVFLVLDYFARLHSISFAFRDQNPAEYCRIAEKIQETYYAEQYRGWYIGFQQETIIPIALDAISQELSLPYIEKFHAIIQNDFFGKIAALACKSGPFSVICHGDAWVPNFLVKYSNNSNMHAVKLIDFQISRCASIATDLLFFLYCCTGPEVRETHWQDILVEYHKKLTNYIRILGSDPQIVKMEDINNEIRSNALFGLGIACEVIPFTLMDSEETPDLGMFVGDEPISMAKIMKASPLKNSEERMRLASIFKHIVDSNYV